MLLTFLLLVVVASVGNAQPRRTLEFGRSKIDAETLAATSGQVYPGRSSDRTSVHTLPARSFYQSRTDWRRIIDSTWGPGLPLANKLAVFDAYASALSNRFDGFISLGLTWSSWDSLKNRFRSRIDSTTSRGIFASIMAQFAMSLRDEHTWAWDRVVTFTSLTPGVPLLVLYPLGQTDHFGAVLTALPDSTALVLRTVPNHPLGLQPGDIVLGYEGVPWKRLVRELLDAQLPVFSTGVGAASAEIHSIIRNVGNNWHLFATIDVLEHSTQDTLHLSVLPLLGLPPDPMMGNEQLEISGIPFSFYRGAPWTTTGQPLNFGRLPSVNIGYIRLLGEWPTSTVDNLFARAVDSLWNTEGLVIDMRWNSGGWALFDQAFVRMFSQRLYTINDAHRISTTTFTLAPVAQSEWYLIPGVQGSIYDRPLAVLLGPTCVSMGDITAQRLRYHPMSRFFGKAPMASMGDNAGLTGYQDWWLNYSIGDMYHMSQPGVYLNRSEFPIDEPVWFNPDDVAQGIDPILARSVNWISTLSYARNVVLSRDTLRGATDSIRITANVRNPANHTLVVSAIVKNGLGATADSIILLPLPGDSLRQAYIRAPGVSGRYSVSVRTDDLTSATYRSLPDVASFTAIVTDVDEHAGGLPREYGLQQNYPNPFNPTTEIRYQMPKVSHVTLKVFDVLGREVATLVNEVQEAGFKSATFDASNLASGVYLYRLQARGFVEARKFVVLR
jgi:hypothetical protein